MSDGLLVLTAHPDDEVLIAGGTLAACAERSIPTSVVCLTRGENGPIARRALATRRTLGAVRAQELKDACAALGVDYVKCYRRQDGGLSWSDRSAIAAQVAAVIDSRRPTAVVSFGEDGLYYHPDHIATYQIARSAVRRAHHPVSLYRSVWAKADMRQLSSELRRRGLSENLWGLEPEDFGVEEDERADEIVTDVRRFTATKLRALQCHQTQLHPDHALARLPAELAERYLGYERFAAVGAGKLRGTRPTALDRLAAD